MVFFSPSREIAVLLLELSHDRFLPYPFQLKMAKGFQIYPLREHVIFLCAPTPTHISETFPVNVHSEEIECYISTEAELFMQLQVALRPCPERLERLNRLDNPWLFV
jgi:hypothetical protein